MPPNSDFHFFSGFKNLQSLRLHLNNFPCLGFSEIEKTPEYINSVVIVHRICESAKKLLIMPIDYFSVRTSLDSKPSYPIFSILVDPKNVYIYS